MYAYIRNFKIVLALATSVAWNPVSASEIESLTTPGGLPFLHIQDDQYENVVLQVNWPYNWSFDTALNPKVPMLSARAVLNGPPEGVEDNVVGQRLRDMQTQSTLIATSESVTGALVTPAGNFEEIARLVNSVLATPAFDPDLANDERRNLLDQSSQLRQGTDAAVGELARNLIMHDHPVRTYFSSSAEIESLIETATLDELKRFYFETVTRSNATIVLASPFASGRAGILLDELFDGLPQGEAIESDESAIDFPDGITVVLHDPDAERSNLTLAGILPPVSQGGEFEDLIALAVLGQGATSELYETLRPELGDSYEFTANALALSSEFRILQISGVVDTDKLEFARQAIRQKYEEFRGNGLSSSIDGIKRRSSAAMRINTENPRILVPLVMENVLNGFPAAKALELPDEIDAISREGINARMLDVFPPVEDLLTVIVTSDPDLVPGACVVETPEEYRACL
ncbi:MAG: insulinase family protein [Gammaproteobacteria bacterium]|nr:insulinase family protein [Gammaproteobacteria bacterium]MYF01381.1 insulinase family protein [Gammaproteobacteria bacterium]